MPQGWLCLASTGSLFPCIFHLIIYKALISPRTFVTLSFSIHTCLLFHYLRQLDAREDKGDNQHDDTNDGIRISRRLQTSQSATYHEEASQEELKRHQALARNEEQGSDAIEHQARDDSHLVAPLADDGSSRQRHDEITTIHHRLHQCRTPLGDNQGVLEMLVQDVEDAMGESPKEEQGGYQGERKEIFLIYYLTHIIYTMKIQEAHQDKDS